MDGDPSRIRTCNPRSRNPLLATSAAARLVRPLEDPSEFILNRLLSS
jgi:hypothetical protein